MRYFLISTACLCLGLLIVGSMAATAEESQPGDPFAVSEFNSVSLESSLGSDFAEAVSHDCDCGKSSCGKASCGHSNWFAGGWLNGGIMLNMTNNAITRNDPVPFSNPAGEFLGNQAWAYFGKEANNGGYGWDWGARVDVMYGADGPDTQSFGDGGWDFGWNSGGEYGTAIPQIYGELDYNNWNFKIGHFYTIMGYEVVQAPGNFFYSHAYTMTYGEPFTHTGLLAEYAYDDNTTIWGGYTTGWDGGFDNRNDANTFLGGVSRQVTDNIKVNYTVNAGRYGNGIGPAGNLGDIFSHSLVVDVQLTDRLNYVFLHDMSINENGGAAANAEWYGVTQYLFYTINDCWKAGFRFEWFDDSDGLRIASVNDGLNDLHYFDATIGLNWTPCENIIVRPEFRFDWSTSHGDMDFNDIYVNNTQDHLETFAIDFIWQYLVELVGFARVPVDKPAASYVSQTG